MSLRKQAILAVLWNGIGNYLGFIISFAGQLILVRLLLPEDFGVVAMAVSIVEVLALLTAWTLSVGIIQMPSEEGLSDTAFWLSLGQTLLLLIITGIVSLGLQAFYVGAPQLVRVFAVIGAARALTPITSIYAAHLEKELHYRALSFLKTVVGLLATSLALALAFTGQGVWSLVARETVISFATLIGLRFLSDYQFRGRFSGDMAMRLIALGNKTLLSRGLEAAYYKVDSLLVGSIAGVTALGFYSQARYVVDLVNAAVAPASGVAIFPIYAKLQHDAFKLRRAFQTGRFLLIRVLLPACILIFLFPEELVTFLFGDQWRPAASFLRWLALYPLLVSLYENSKALLYGIGRLGATALVRAIQIVTLIPMIIIGYRALGVEGVAIAATLSALVGLITMHAATRSYMSEGVLETLLRPMTVALVTTLSGFWLKQRLVSPPEGPYLLCLMILVIGVYTSLLLLLEFGLIREYFATITSALRTEPPASDNILS